MTIRSTREILEGLEQFAADQELLWKRSKRLTRTHPGQWAAVYKGRTVLASSLEKLVQKLGANAPRAPVMFLDTTRKTFIFSKTLERPAA